MSKSAPNNRIREARRKMYRQVITQSAEAVFAKKGFADARMGEVALEAGISLKTLYATFPGKVELFAAIRNQRIDEVMALSSAVSEGPPLKVMMNRVRVTVEYLLANPDFLRIHLREGNAWAVGSGDVPRPTPDHWHANVSEQAKTIQRGIDEGVFEDGDPELLVKMVSAVYQVQLADWLQREVDASSDILVERIQAFVARMLLRAPAR
jgi:AcrR family transcriptional regulator